MRLSFAAQVFSALLVACTLATAGDAVPGGENPAVPATVEYWYVVAVIDGSDDKSTSAYWGSSKLDLDQIAKAMGERAGFRLDNLRVRNDDEKWVRWEDQEPTERGTILLNPSRVISVIPLIDDPIRVKPPVVVPKDDTPRM